MKKVIITKLFTALFFVLTVMPAFSEMSFKERCTAAVESVSKCAKDLYGTNKYNLIKDCKTPDNLSIAMVEDNASFSKGTSAYNTEYDKCDDAFRAKKYTIGQNLTCRDSSCTCNPSGTNSTVASSTAQQYDRVQCGCPGIWSCEQDVCKDQAKSKATEQHKQALIAKHCTEEAQKKAAAETAKTTTAKGFHKPCSAEDFKNSSYTKNALTGWYSSDGKCVAEKCDEEKGYFIAKNAEGTSDGYCKYVAKPSEFVNEYKRIIQVFENRVNQLKAQSTK